MNTQSVWHRRPAPAKLNLFLHITRQRDDGMHCLQTIFQFLDIGDTIATRLRDDGIINFQDEALGLGEENLVVRAARLLQKTAQVQSGADIRLEKRLPAGGGLGGGSSDAATTLVMLNGLWQCGLSRSQLAELGLSLGADVPVFIYGHAAWAEGVGEQFTQVTPPEPWYLVVKPAIEVSTAEIFSRSELTRDCPPITIRDFLSGQTQNVCEPVVRQHYPEVDKALNWLDKYASARLTGTGSCIFADFETRQQAEIVQLECPEKWQSFVAKGCNHSPLYADDAAEV